MHNDFPHETMAFADKREFITDEDGANTEKLSN